MEEELKSLEDKVFQLLRLHQNTTNEIKKLSKDLAKTHARCKKLNKKIRVAADRLEALLLIMPTK